MFTKLDYCDSNYPFKFDNKFSVYQILKNTKKLCRHTRTYSDYTQSYTKMTTKSTYKVPEVREYPVLQNCEMISITRKRYDTKDPDKNDKENKSNDKELIGNNSENKTFVIIFLYKLEITTTIMFILSNSNRSN